MDNWRKILYIEAYGFLYNHAAQNHVRVGEIMAGIAVLGITAAAAAGLCLAAWGFRKQGSPGRSLLLFLLPVLCYLILHFSAEAYAWGQVWEKAQQLANSSDVTLESAIAAALVDLKLLFTVFLLMFWLLLWWRAPVRAGRSK